MLENANNKKLPNKTEELTFASNFSVVAYLIHHRILDEEEVVIVQDGDEPQESEILPPLMYTRFPAVKSLDISGFTIERELLALLLELFPNLQKISLRIEDIMPLKALKDLRELKLFCSQVKDLSCIPASVEKLDLNFCEDIEDFEHPKELSNLKELSLLNTHIINLSCIPATVENLTLSRCQYIKNWKAP